MIDTYRHSGTTGRILDINHTHMIPFQLACITPPAPQILSTGSDIIGQQTGRSGQGPASAA